MDEFTYEKGTGLSGRDFFAVTKSDTTDYLSSTTLKLPKALYVGGAGDVAVQTLDGVTTVTFVGVQAGSILPIRPRKVMAATTATSIVAIV